MPKRRIVVEVVCDKPITDKKLSSLVLSALNQGTCAPSVAHQWQELSVRRSPIRTLEYWRSEAAQRRKSTSKLLTLTDLESRLAALEAKSLCS